MLDRESSRARHAGDARRHALSVDDVGDPDGTPVVYLHGGGDSRLSRHPDDWIAAELGVRLLAVDRCGPVERARTLRDWAERLVAALDVERFGVIGWSAGGPHALAVAAVAPERVGRVALVALDAAAGRGRSTPGRRAPRDAHRALLAAARCARARAVGEAPAAADRRPGHATRRMPAAAPSRFATAGCGSRASSPTSGRPWGFELADVRAPVTLWWGERDVVCPPSIGRDYEERLPNATLRLSDDTHQILFSRWRELLADAAR